MTDPQSRPAIVIINGSVRPGNYTAMASALVADEFSRDGGFPVDVIDPGTLDLPLPGSRPRSDSTRRLEDAVRAAAAVVLVTPEYHGSFSSVMKLVIENLGFPSALASKPVGLVGVAAGAIGAIKSLEQLRSVCSHVGALTLPLPVSVAFVQKVFSADGRCLDPAVEKRLRGAATQVLNYLRGHVCPAIQLEQVLREGAA